jgi:NADH-quinone oxidoreductase subunit D
MLAEVIVWVDSLVGLLHRSTELLAEHRLTSHISGYLSRTDYVAHMQLESMSLLLGTRFRSSSRDTISTFAHLTWLANHLLNITCSLGDLGCISYILWGFEDRESIFTELEANYGARLHIHADSLLTGTATHIASTLLPMLRRLTSRWHTLAALLDLRLLTDRLSSHAHTSTQSALGHSYSGIWLHSTGTPIDLRSDCTGYSRSSITTTIGGVMSCSLIRLQVRLFLSRQD